MFSDKQIHMDVDTIFLVVKQSGQVSEDKCRRASVVGQAISVLCPVNFVFFCTVLLCLSFSLDKSAQSINN